MSSPPQRDFSRVAHQEFAFPILLGIPAAYQAGIKSWEYLQAGRTWYKRAEIVKDIYSKATNITSFLSGQNVGDSLDGESLDSPSVISYITNAATWSLSSIMTFYAGKNVLNTFIQQNGPSAGETLTNMTRSIWENVSADSSKSKIKNNLLQASAIAMEKQGSEAQQQQQESLTSSFSREHNKTLILLVAATLAFYTHSLGALEMQKQIQKIEDNDSLDDGGAAWHKIDPSAPPPTKTIQQRGLSSEYLRGLYASNTFYNSKQGIPFSELLKVNDINLQRTIFNILLGASIQASTFLGLNSNKDQDAITRFSKWANLVMYWEILARLLKMHGWAPVYLALRQISELLQSDTAPGGNAEHINSKTKTKEQKPRRKNHL